MPKKGVTRCLLRMQTRVMFKSGNTTYAQGDGIKITGKTRRSGHSGSTHQREEGHIKKCCSPPNQDLRWTSTKERVLKKKKLRNTRKEAQPLFLSKAALSIK